MRGRREHAENSGRDRDAERDERDPADWRRWRLPFMVTSAASANNAVEGRANTT
jgi:hypothetical protein